MNNRVLPLCPPISTIKLESKSFKEGDNNQKLMLFIRGKAIYIWSSKYVTKYFEFVKSDEIPIEPK